MIMNEPALIEKRDERGAVMLTMNRPANFNALSEEMLAALQGALDRMMLSIQKLPVPVIARVQGLATAAGCQLVAQCDLAVASTEASFAVSGVNFGLFCATPSVPLLRNIAPKQAMEMLLTGDFINAQLLGSPNQQMIGTVIQNQFLEVRDYPLAASLSFVLMAVITLGVLAYARVLGTEELA